MRVNTRYVDSTRLQCEEEEEEEEEEGLRMSSITFTFTGRFQATVMAVEGLKTQQPERRVTFCPTAAGSDGTTVFHVLLCVCVSAAWPSFKNNNQQ